ncbi:MAG TPA: DUF5915 domain-containing protein, partial [Candidatus Eisenbacteria bacterium]|nr:DUF5915 domain-containing protein [Candidatus Eisenbacteria bacterium]
RGLAVTDRVRLRLGGAPALIAALRLHETFIAGETLATHLDIVPLDPGAMVWEVDGDPVSVLLEKA